MVTGDVMAVTGITSVNGIAHYAKWLQIDHIAAPVAWSGGAAPTAGGASGYDVYSFNIVKIANAKYAVIGNHVESA